MKTWVKVVIGIVIAVLLVGAVGGVVAWTQSDKFDQKKLSPIGRYSIGGLDSNGNYTNTNKSIYTKDPFECQGLNCTLDFDAEVTYQIYFYDQNKDFVHTTGSLDKSFAEDSVPFFAKYARIVITPKDDNKVTSLEKDKYAKQLTVKVNREQGYKNYTDNLSVLSKEGYSLDEQGQEIVPAQNANIFMTIKQIDISGYKEALMFKVGGGFESDLKLAFYDISHNFISKGLASDYTINIFESSEGITYVQLSLSRFPEGTRYFAASMSKLHPIEFYLR